MTDEQLIENHTIFFAYFCYLIEQNLVDSTEELCEIGMKLDEEISNRRITNSQIEDYLKKVNLNPQDQLMVGKYIYPAFNLNSDKTGQC
mgnify:FL=1